MYKTSFELFPQVKLLTLKNPSSSVVSVEIRALSLYPAPLEALDLLTKWYEPKNTSPVSIVYSGFLSLSPFLHLH